MFVSIITVKYYIVHSFNRGIFHRHTAVKRRIRWTRFDT